MESTQSKVRYKLMLGKFPVREVRKSPTGFVFLLDMLQGVKLAVEVPAHADVREGDWLTLYTEVLTNAQPSTASVQ
jgi:hypothetical protein